MGNAKRKRAGSGGKLSVGRDNIRIGQARDVTLVTENPLPPGVEPISIEPPLGRRDERFPLRGRDDLIGQLAGLLDRSDGQPRTRILHGLGGCGKTAVALEVAHTARMRGMQVWWVTGDRTSVTAGMHAVGRRLKLTEEQLLGSDAADLVWRRLAAHHDRWLLVIDNADEPEVLSQGLGPVADGRGWLRPHRNHRGLVVVTSRDGDPSIWGSWSRRYRIDVLAPEAGAQVLIDHVPGSEADKDQAEELAKRLGGLPLALRIAGSYLALTTAAHAEWSGEDAIETFQDYRRALDNGQLELLARGEDDEGRDTISRTWNLSLDLLDRRGMPQARNLLYLLSTFADAAIPYKLLLQPERLAQSPLPALAMAAMSAQYTSKGNHRLAKTRNFLIGTLRTFTKGLFPPLFPRLSGTDLHRLLEALAHLSLVELDVKDGPAAGSAKRLDTLSIHPLVRDVANERAEPALTILALSLLGHAMDKDRIGVPQNPAEWDSWYALAPHGSYVYKNFPSLLIEDSRLGDRMVRKMLRTLTTDVGALTVEFLNASGDYAAAKALQQEVSETIEDSLVPRRFKLSGRRDLANALGYAGDPAEARDRLAALVPVWRRVYGPEHLSTIGLEGELARWTGEAGDKIAARDQFAVELQVRERVSGAEDPGTLTARSNLAHWTGMAGDTTAARDQLAALLPVRERVSGAEHPHTLNERGKLALWTGRSGDPAAARDMLAALLPVRERVSGTEHPDTLNERGNLAHWTGKAGDAAAAKQQLAALLPVRERVSGTEHHHTLNDRGNLALWTGEAGDAAAARDQFATLLPVRERVTGPEHPSTLTIRSNLAHWTGRAGDATAARQQFAALLSVQQRVNGANHPDTLAVRRHLAYWTERRKAKPRS